MKMCVKWFVAFILVTIMWKLAYRSGEINGEHGVGYWEGWQDAMLQTDYGKKQYDCNKSPLDL